MSYLIFCAIEVGGLPYRMAEILNAHGVETYYASIAKPHQSHDSTQFHYGQVSAPWDLTPRFREIRRSGKRVKTLLSQIRREFNFTHVLATGQKAYLLREAGLPYNYWSFGSDLDWQVSLLSSLAYCYPWWAWPRGLLAYLLLYWREARRTFTNASAVMIAPYQLAAYRRVCPDKPLFFLPHFFKIEDLETLAARKLASRRELGAKIGAARFFFSSTRQVWSGLLRRSSDNKGNDVILRAFREYLDLAGDREAKLVLVAKGPDVGASRALARKLNLNPRVVWAREMPRAQLDQYYQGAGLCFGQFGTPVLTFAALEPMAQANVSISYFEPVDPQVPWYAAAPPAFRSRDPREIGEFMARIAAAPREYADLCQRSWAWVKENCSEARFAAEFVKSFSLESDRPSG